MRAASASDARRRLFVVKGFSRACFGGAMDVGCGFAGCERCCAAFWGWQRRAEQATTNTGILRYAQDDERERVWVSRKGRRLLDGKERAGTSNSKYRDPFAPLRMTSERECGSRERDCAALGMTEKSRNKQQQIQGSVRFAQDDERERVGLASFALLRMTSEKVVLRERLRGLREMVKKEQEQATANTGIRSLRSG
jgi:hypothetical protein